MKSLQAYKIGHILDVHIGGAVLFIEPSLMSKGIEVTLYRSAPMNDKNYVDYLTARFDGERWAGKMADGTKIECFTEGEQS